MKFWSLPHPNFQRLLWMTPETNAIWNLWVPINQVCSNRCTVFVTFSRNTALPEFQSIGIKSFKTDLFHERDHPCKVHALLGIVSRKSLKMCFINNKCMVPKPNQCCNFQGLSELWNSLFGTFPNIKETVLNLLNYWV